MSTRKCGCVYADASNTPSVRSGHEMSGYLKTPCAEHQRDPMTDEPNIKNRLAGGGDGVARAKSSWESMRRRCTDPGQIPYRYYGGRGIRVCDRWASSFEAFLADMGPRPPRHTLDRIDSNGNYEPGNCRWADYKTQANNQRHGGTTGENAAKTHCIHGHELSGENLYVTARGRRHCKACQRRIGSERKRRLKLERAK